MASVPVAATRATVHEHERGAPDWTGTTLVLMTIGLVAGFGILLLTVPIGSGDYGQWLMASRYYSGLPEPAYRAIGEVPPLIPWLLAQVRAVVPDPVMALHLMSVGLLVLLAGGFAVTAGTIFRSRAAGFAAAALALCGTDQFLGLFSFGGLLQVAALGFSALSIAAFTRASRPRPGGGSSWPIWVAGSLALVFAALSHLATGAIALAAGAFVALLGVARIHAQWRDRLRALLPLLVCLALVGTWWVIVLLPGSAAYVTNPASLNYRGPDRLWESLTGYWPTVALMGTGTLGLLVGVATELRRRTIGPFVLVAAWLAVVGGGLAWSVVTGAATDYPRFTTPLLAPMVVGAAGTLVTCARWLGARRMNPWPARPAVLGVGLAAVLVVAGGPLAMNTYASASRGYALADAAGLEEASAWIAANVPADATVLAPTREGKWIEGLTGRAALFDNPVRYSFRPGEWARSIAARALLQSSASMTNDFFLLRATGGDPCGSFVAPDSLSIAANHGGEFLDLLSVSAAGTSVLSGGSVLATVGNLSAVPGPPPAVEPEAVSSTAAWSGERQGKTISYHRRVTVTSGQSAMQIVDVATSQLPISGLRAALRPAAGMAITGVDVYGSTAVVTFTAIGRSEPQLRITVAGTSASITQATDGSLVANVLGTQMQLVVVDLTPSAEPIAGLGWLCPAAIATKYQVGAILLRRDAAFPSRFARLAAIGFTSEHDFGGYAVLARP